VAEKPHLSLGKIRVWLISVAICMVALRIVLWAIWPFFGIIISALVVITVAGMFFGPLSK